MGFLNDSKEEIFMEEMKSEIEAMNTFGQDNFGGDYQTLSELRLEDALEELSNLLEAVRKEEEGPIPSGLLQFRYDGGSKSEDEVTRKENARTTSIILGWKENEGMKVQIKPLPYHEFEKNRAGLRVSGYGILERKYLKE